MWELRRQNKRSAMKLHTLPVALLTAALLLVADLARAFAPPRPHLQLSTTSSFSFSKRTSAREAGPLFGFMGDKERDRLTRDSEPEEYFRTCVCGLLDSRKRW